MDSAILFYTVLLVSVVGFSSAHSIPFRRPCKDMSPECVKESMQADWLAVENGVPEQDTNKLGSKVKSDEQKFLDLKSSDIESISDVEGTDGMTNVFKGSSAISDAILNFINGSWKLASENFGRPIVEHGVNCVLKNIMGLFGGMSNDGLMESM